MRKLVLVAGCLLSSFELLAGNFVPVCLNVATDEQRMKVYQAIVDNSFVTQLDLARSSKLSLEDKNEVINDEPGFLKNKIKSVAPEVEVAFIPKSLYQLFVWNYYVCDVVCGEEGIQKDKIQIMFSVVLPYNFWGTTYTKGKIGFGLKAETPKNIDDFCNSYMSNEDVRSYFYKINDSIIPFFGGIPTEQISNLENLRKITKTLLENISPNAKMLDDAQKGYFYEHRLLKHTKNLTDDFAETVADLIVKEAESPENSYRIYRGERREGGDRDPQSFYSFSDGIFGGIVRDWSSGMAFNYSLSSLHMKIIDLPKEELLNVKTDSDDIEESGLAVHIPPVISMGAALGAGEFHHVRTKIQADFSIKAESEKVSSFYHGLMGLGEVSRKGTPWLYSYTSPIENFWKRCKLEEEKEYKISSTNKMLNVKTYRLVPKKAG